MTSPTVSLKSRELIGTDAFSQRREVFGKRDTVFHPTSPTCLTPSEFAQERGKKVSSFRRTPAHSSMRESRNNEVRTEIGPHDRKMSSNVTLDLNTSDIDYRHSMTERTRRISKLRQEFLTSNLHEPSEDPFTRTGSRVSMPVKSSSGSYTLLANNVYKFTIAESYSTPLPSRKIIITSEIDGEVKENVDPKYLNTLDKRPSPHEVSIENKTTNPHKMFTELMKRYSPQSKSIDMTLPPTKPRVIGAMVKQLSAGSSDDKLEINVENIEIVETKLEIKEDSDRPNETNNENQNVHLNIKDEPSTRDTNASSNDMNKVDSFSREINNINVAIKTGGEDSKNKINGHPNDSYDDSSEKDDEVPEMPNMRQDSRLKKNIPVNDNIPSLLQKIEKVPENSDSAKEKKNIKRKQKRSFLDKLFNRNKDKKIFK